MIKTLSPTRRLRRALANGYRNWRFGANFQPASKLGMLTGLLFPAQRAVLNRELRYLPKFRPGVRVLDIGAGNGKFLAKARELGWEVVGVEPDPAAVAAARSLGLDVRKGDVESLVPEGSSFDVITMSHVIEHLHDPRRVLDLAFSLLKPNGRIYIDTPNIDAFGHKRFGRYWRGLESPRHLVLFNWVSLEGLLRDVGFSRVIKYPRTDIYTNLAAISRGIREQSNTNEECRPTPNDRLLGWVMGWKTKVAFRDSEFITLVAFKG
jgi:2-polyprenyl-3-methyl-5-hydroxy-6-metoxy-1,4-benzoquinol methylase